MQLFSLFVTLAAAVGAFAQAVADPSINTPVGVMQCLPTQLTFSGTAPPFVITVVPEGQTGAAPLVTVGTTSDTALTWVANLPPNVNYTLVIRDALGRINGSAPFLIYPNTSSPTPTCSVVAYTPAPSSAAPAPASSAPPPSSAPAPASSPAFTPAPAIRGRVVV
ncbi:hypothetical protein M407DRAFT_241712 [Tulasnella calospora MUT 4182]|uniref:Fibronectin type-III domain-containing protein n=1 Tax=Tulasnella calospora MUT 4182 TaxID=1051891 RepID=A0A0C3QTM1_9AGAM|nr:hypothetical protein M407DRAFT_241712 [Tulasnella calospora MUT 4182]